MTGFNERQRPKGIKLFKTLALIGFMIDIITFGAIFIVLGHDSGGPLECTSINGLCPGTTKIYQPHQSLLQTPTWSPDPFTVTGTTPVVLPGLQAYMKPIGVNHPYVPMILFDVEAKVSAGATCNVVLYFNASMQGIGVFFTSTTQVEESAFIAENTTIAPIIGPTLVDLRANCNIAGQTMSVYATDPTALFEVTYMSIFDLNTNTGTSAIPP